MQQRWEGGAAGGAPAAEQIEAAGALRNPGQRGRCPQKSKICPCPIVSWKQLTTLEKRNLSLPNRQLETTDDTGTDDTGSTFMQIQPSPLRRRVQGLPVQIGCS